MRSRSLALLSGLFVFGCGQANEQETPDHPSSSSSCADVCANMRALCGFEPPNCVEGCKGALSAQEIECSAQASSCEAIDACAVSEPKDELCTFTSRCDGDVVERCDDSSGQAVTTRTTCAQGCSMGSCKQTDERPETLELNERFSPKEPTSVGDPGDGKLYHQSIYVVNASFRPSIPDGDGLELGHSSVVWAMASPSFDGCPLRISGKLLGSTAKWNQLQLVIGGEDMLPSTACINFLKQVNRVGMSLKIKQVPYSSGEGTTTIHVELKPE